MRTPVPSTLPVKANGSPISLKFDETAKKNFLAAIRQGYPLDQAAGIAGVSRQTLWRHRRSDPDLNDDIEKARGMFALSTILKMDEIATKAGDGVALDHWKWRLEKAMPETFGKQAAYNKIGQQNNVFVAPPLPSFDEILERITAQRMAALERERATATIIDVTPEPSPDC